MNTPRRPFAVLLLLWILSPLTSIQAEAVEAVSLLVVSTLNLVRAVWVDTMHAPKRA
jgi:hypothetical protein